MKYILGSALIIIILIACGKKEVPEGYTKVIFNTHAESHSKTPSGMNKGVMVYARETGGTFKSLAKHGTSISNFLSTNSQMILPNGTYKFFAIGFNTTSTATPPSSTPQPFDGNYDSRVYCGVGNSGQEVTLNGTNATVNITITEDSNVVTNGTNCGEEFADLNSRINTPYSSPYVGAPNKVIRDITVRLCSNGPFTYPSPTCNTGVTPTYTPYMQVELHSYNEITGTGKFSNDPAKVLTKCGASGIYFYVYNFPRRIVHPFKIKIWDSANCTGNLRGTFEFPNGFEGIQSDGNSYVTQGTAEKRLGSKVVTPDYLNLIAPP